MRLYVQEDTVLVAIPLHIINPIALLLRKHSIVISLSLPYILTLIHHEQDIFPSMPISRFAGALLVERDQNISSRSQIFLIPMPLIHDVPVEMLPVVDLEASLDVSYKAEKMQKPVRYLSQNDTLPYQEIRTWDHSSMKIISMTITIRMVQSLPWELLVGPHLCLKP
jgi:hypothetical protein